MSLSALGTGTLNFFDGTAWRPVGGAAAVDGFTFPMHWVNTSFTSGGTANTKGSWVEVVASTSEDVSLLAADGWLFVSGAETNWLIDYAVGASGSEQVIIENLNCGFSSGGNARYIPISIPKGSRLSARVQSNRTNDTRTFVTQLFGGGAATNTTVDVIGTLTASSRPTSMAGINTWYQLVASTSKTYRQIILYPGGLTGNMAALAGNVWLATGAAGAESEICGRTFVTQANEIIWTPFSNIVVNTASAVSLLGAAYTGTVASGTRLAIRISAGNAEIGLFVVGVPA